MTQSPCNSSLSGANRRKPKAFDVFCGCGGMTRGLRDAGFQVIGGIESDLLAVKTYRENHRRVKVWDKDIRDLKPAKLLKQLGLKRGQLDLLTGCPPCQAFSAMRRLNGKRKIRDKDSKDLVLEFLRFVKGFRPKVVMIENVPRLIHDYRFNDVIRDLRTLGYVGEPHVFNAADYGVPQRRRRMIFIASRVGEIGYAEPCRTPPPVVRDVLQCLPEPGSSGDLLHDFPETRSKKVAAMIQRIPKDGGSRLALGDKAQLNCHKDFDGFKDVYGRMAWDDVSPTITSGCVNPSKGRFLHPEQDRAITLREAALLQSFPSEYWFSLDRGKFAAALMIGNAFPPDFVKPHARRIYQHLRNWRKRSRKLH